MDDPDYAPFRDGLLPTGCDMLCYAACDSLQQVHHGCILLPILRLTPPMEGFPWDDLRKILHGGQKMAKVYSSEEILPKGSTF